MRASMQVAYLQSYTSMGFVKYQCMSGCSCKPGFIDSHVEESKVSVTVVKSILVRAFNSACLTHALLTIAHRHDVWIRSCWLLLICTVTL